ASISRTTRTKSAITPKRPGSRPPTSRASRRSSIRSTATDPSRIGHGGAADAVKAASASPSTRFMKHPRTLTLSHWGVYEVEYDETGKAIRLHPFAKDPDPSAIGLHMLSDEVERLRVRRPAVRKSWLEQGPGACPERRGTEPFVEIAWDEAFDLVAGELARVKREFGNKAIFGGSYGWSSAGRFHHAQSQIRSFLNSIGGFVRHQDDYSVGAALVLMPHIVGPLEELLASHTSWDVLARHCELFVSFGGVPRKNGQINAGGAVVHRIRSGLFSLREAGVRFVNVTP